ncbi:MAG: DNA polymerase III subunit delta [Clostridiales bacterium]|nr:DNA polymerase III subunit delta [Clostridiales bacterium]
MDFQEFYQHIKQRTIARLYLFEGEEEYGKDSALADLKKALLSGPMAMVNESVLTNPTNSEIIAACETLPLMEERRLVVVKESQQLLGRAAAKASTDEEEDAPASSAKGKDDLVPYLDRLPDTVCLVFFVRGKANGSKRLYKKIRELGGLVNFDILDQSRLNRWVEREFANYDLKIDRQTAEHLIFAVGKELLTLKGEIAKIAAFAHGQELVTLQDIDAIATLSVEYRVFDLSDKVADGRAGEALPLMQEMLKGGESRLMLLALLQRHYRQLLLARIMTQDRASQTSIASELSVPGFVVRRIVNSAMGYSIDQLKTAYLQCIHQEYLIKSGQIAEEGSLEQLVLELIALKKESAVQRRA